MGTKNPFYIEKDILYDEYITKNLPLSTISDIHKCTKKQLTRLLKIYSIKKSDELVRECRRKTNLTKYGCENPSSSDIVKNKKSINNPFSRPEVQEKIRLTNLKKYGVDNPMKSNEIKEKAFNTNLKKYGVKSVTSSSEIRSKMVSTLMQKYGVDNPNKIPSVKEKKQIAQRKKYSEIVNNNVDPTIVNVVVETAKLLESNNNRKPTSKELANYLNYSHIYIQKIVKDNNLQSYVDFKPYSSIYEIEIIEFIKSFSDTTIIRNDKNIIFPYELDIYLPEYNIAIEFNGDYWHSSLYHPKNYHLKKSICCDEKGIRLIQIYEHEWDDDRTKNIIKSMIKTSLGNSTKIYARNCIIKKITNSIAKPFNEEHHLQGHRNASVTYGLYYNDELVQLMSFSKNRKYEWEIIRGCPGSNNVVVGGVSKLFKHFIKEYNPKEIFSYCDFNKFDGRGYLSIGMKFIGYTGPDLSYIINGETRKRSPGHYKENNAVADAKIWGSGSKKYLWERSE